MIAYLEGLLSFKSAESAIVLAGGVGYEVMIPLSTFYSLPEKGEIVELHVKTVLREDSLQLFGFFSLAEKETFLLLNSVSKVGPRLALNILSGITPAELVSAITQRDVARLNSVPGVGTKTAERLIMELKDKVAKMAVVHDELAPAPMVFDQDDQDVISALLNLGYRQTEAEKAIAAARHEGGDDAPLSELIRLSLKRLQKA